MLILISSAIRRITAVILVTLAGAAPLSADPETDLARQAQEIVKQFAGQLKPQLQQAMREGGPPLAVKVCAETAPLIADSLSESTGWSVRRVSDRPRNPKAVMDDWETRAFRTLETRLEQGNGEALITYETTQKGFRYVQAQVTEGLCLSCHGAVLDANTTAALELHYPNDQAKGYQLGEIRGLFSLQKSLTSPADHAD